MAKRAKSYGRTRCYKPRELKKLAERRWSKLSENQRFALRSWRAAVGAETKRARHWEPVLEKLNAPNKKTRRGAASELRKLGTQELASYLKESKRFKKREIKSAFAFWYYS